MNGAVVHLAITNDLQSQDASRGWRYVLAGGPRNACVHLLTLSSVLFRGDDAVLVSVRPFFGLHDHATPLIDR